MYGTFSKLKLTGIVSEKSEVTHNFHFGFEQPLPCHKPPKVPLNLWAPSLRNQTFLDHPKLLELNLHTHSVGRRVTVLKG